jgi:hypothetical protein
MLPHSFPRIWFKHPLHIGAPRPVDSHPAWVAYKQLVRDEWEARKEANEAMLKAGPPTSKHGRLLSVETRHYINCLLEDVGATLDHDRITNEDFRSELTPEELATAPPAIKGTWNTIKEANRFFKKTRKERAALHLPVPPGGAISCSCECCSAREYVSKQRKLIKWRVQLRKDHEKADEKWKFKHVVGMFKLVRKLEKELKEEKEKKRISQTTSASR